MIPRTKKRFALKTSFEARFSPDGKFCALLGRGEIQLINTESREIVWRTTHLKHPSSLTFTPDGEFLAAKSTSGRIVVFETASGKLRCDHANHSEGEGSNILSSNCGQYLIDGAWAGFLRVRNLRKKSIAWEERYPGEMIIHIAAANKGQDWIIQHDPRDQPQYFVNHKWEFGARPARKLPQSIPFSLSFGVDSKASLMAVLSNFPQVRLELSRAKTGDNVGSIGCSVGGCGYHLEFSPNGKILGVVEDKRIALYDTSSLQLFREFTMEFPCYVSFSPDNKLVALGSWKAGEIVRLAD